MWLRDKAGTDRSVPPTLSSCINLTTLHCCRAGGMANQGYVHYATAYL